MPFPSSFETTVALPPAIPHDLDPTKVATVLERGFAERGARVVGSDGSYFEFQYSLKDDLFVRGGSLTTTSNGQRITVKVEATVRAVPALILVFALIGFLRFTGEPPVGIVLSVILAGGLIQLVYLRAMVKFRKAIADLCHTVKDELGFPTSVTMRRLL